MMGFWKSKKEFYRSGQQKSLSEREIQERIYGRYVGPQKESRLEDTVGPEAKEIVKKEAEDKAGLKEAKPGKTKTGISAPEQVKEKIEKQQIDEQKIYIEQLKREKDALAKEVVSLKHKYLNLNKQKSALEEKVTRLEAELSGIKNKCTLTGAGQLKENLGKFFSSLYRRLGVKNTIWAGVGILVIIVAISLVCSAIRTRNKISPEIYEQISSSLDSQVGEKNKPVVSVDREPFNSSPQKLPFTIQVCVYQKYSDAKNLMNRFKAKGYEVDIVEVSSPKGNRHYRIYVGNFLTREQAEPILHRIKSEEGFRDSFIRRR